MRGWGALVKADLEYSRENDLGLHPLTRTEAPTYGEDSRMATDPAASGSSRPYSAREWSEEKSRTRGVACAEGGSERSGSAPVEWRANEYFQTPRRGVAGSGLRRAYERQECFACAQVKSVANMTEFVSPVASIL